MAVTKFDQQECRTEMGIQGSRLDNSLLFRGSGSDPPDRGPRISASRPGWAMDNRIRGLSAQILTKFQRIKLRAAHGRSPDWTSYSAPCEQLERLMQDKAREL